MREKPSTEQNRPEIQVQHENVSQCAARDKAQPLPGLSGPIWTMRCGPMSLRSRVVLPRP